MNDILIRLICILWCIESMEAIVFNVKSLMRFKELLNIWCLEVWTENKNLFYKYYCNLFYTELIQNVLRILQIDLSIFNNEDYNYYLIEKKTYNIAQNNSHNAINSRNDTRHCLISTQCAGKRWGNGAA